MRRVIVTGFSVRKELFDRVEAQRGDIPRSRFLTRLIEQGLKPGLEKKKMMDLVTSQQSTTDTFTTVASIGKEDGS